MYTQTFDNKPHPLDKKCVRVCFLCVYFLSEIYGDTGFWLLLGCGRPEAEDEE